MDVEVWQAWYQRVAIIIAMIKTIYTKYKNM